jgi:Uncharacterized bacitracin resistance protein
MPLYQIVILAIIQGLTEFLPISSTAHLYLAPWLLGWEDPGLSFDIALHIGTLAAVLIYFFRDWVQVIGQGLGISLGTDEELKKNRMLLWLLAAATIPVGLFGLAFNKQAEGSWRNPYVIGIMMIVVAILMLIAERVGKRTRNIGQINAVDAGVIGLSQALAVIPGTSRSGITITSGYFATSTARRLGASHSCFRRRPLQRRPPKLSTICTSMGGWLRRPARRFSSASASARRSGVW